MYYDKSLRLKLQWSENEINDEEYTITIFLLFFSLLIYGVNKSPIVYSDTARSVPYI